VRPYGELNLVEIADKPGDFIHAAEKILSNPHDSEWLARVDAFIGNLSWDQTWNQMSSLIDAVVARKRPLKAAAVPLSRVGQRTAAANP
jgi:UDP-galactopyranose mutase